MKLNILNLFKAKRAKVEIGKAYKGEHKIQLIYNKEKKRWRIDFTIANTVKVALGLGEWNGATERYRKIKEYSYKKLSEAKKRLRPYVVSEYTIPKENYSYKTERYNVTIKI